MNTSLRTHARRFNVALAGAMLVLVLPMFALNLLVDPFEVVRDLDGRCTIQPDAHEDRVSVPYAMRRHPAEVLLVGSSRVRYLVSDDGSRTPSPAKTERYFGTQRVFNAAISGVNVHVMRRVVEHGLALGHLREVVLLLDDVAMNDFRPDGAGWKESRYGGGRQAESRLDALGNFLNPTMARLSWATFWANWARPVKAAAAPAPRSRDVLAVEWRQRLREFYRRDLYGCYRVSAATMAELDLTLRRLTEGGVRTYVLTPAIHASLVEMRHRTGSAEAYERHLRALAETTARHGVPLWHFSPYAEITQPSPLLVDYLGDPRYHDVPNYADPGHANARIGRVMLALAKGMPPEDGRAHEGFATRVTPGRVDALLARLARDREGFLRSHPDILDLLPPAEPSDCP